jgi:hypothetical protein
MASPKARAAQSESVAMSTGVGESKVFGGGPEVSDLQDFENPRHLANCTLNGKPIPEHLWHQVPYELTDQGTAEYNQGKEPVHVKIIRDEVHSQIGRRGEDLSRGKISVDASGVVSQEIIERGVQPYDASDPMRELVLEHVPVGMRPKFLSSRLVNTTGSTRGYTICRDANGDPVRLGTSLLGYIPEERALAMQKQFEDKSRDAQREIYQDTKDLKQDVANRGFGPSRAFENPGPEGFDPSLHTDPGEDFSLDG